MDDNSAVKKVMVLLLTCDQRELTLDCINSLVRSDHPLDIVVVDNGSSDGTAEALKREYPFAAVLRLNKNLGVGAGRNLGVRYFLLHTQYDYLYILDNDTVVFPDTISCLAALADNDPRIGVTGGFLFYYDNPAVIHNGGGGYIDWRRGSFYGTMRGEILGAKEIVREVDVVIGATIFAKREVFEKAGLFSEEYFYDREDSEWGWRVMKAGYKLVVTSRARILHKVSRSMGMESPKFYYYRTRGRLHFMKKNAGAGDRFLFFFYYCYELLFDTMPTLILNKQFAQIKGVFSGILDFMLGRYGEKKGI